MTDSNQQDLTLVRTFYSPLLERGGARIPFPENFRRVAITFDGKICSFQEVFDAFLRIEHCPQSVKFSSGMVIVFSGSHCWRALRYI